MELGWSLGETKKPSNFLSKNREIGNTGINTTAANRNQNDSGLGFCMGLGISTNGKREAKRRAGGSEDGEYLDESPRESCRNRQRVSCDPSSVQLDLLPLAPVPRQTLSLHWSSHNGSSERDSSEKGLREFDLNKSLSPEDELSLPKSLASSFPMEFSPFGGVGNGGVGGMTDSVAARNKLFEAEGASSKASGEDENGPNSGKKPRLTKEQSAFLDESFKEHKTLNPKQKIALAKQLNLRPSQIESWFGNRRARTKSKQKKVDHENLKRSYETVTEENRRLHKELQEFRV